jgi:hypothetical protein
MINPIVTEQTTAVTDLILGVVSLALLVQLYRMQVNDGLKRRFWSWMYGFLAMASFLGSAAHGFVWPDFIVKAIWHVLYLLLGFTVAFFAVGAIHELWGASTSKKMTPFILVSAFFFYLVTAFVPGSFLVFIGYEAVALAGALFIYLYLGFRDRAKACFLMVAGIAVSLMAAVIQAAGSMRITVIWKFNHNGIFHLVQIAGIIIIYCSLRISLCLSKSKNEKTGESL